MLRKKPNNQSGLGSIKLGMCYAAKDGISVTRFGDFLHFGQPFKADGNNYFTKITHIVGQFL